MNSRMITAVSCIACLAHGSGYAQDGLLTTPTGSGIGLGASSSIHFGGGVLFPYVGLGYRYLYDDPRGTTSTGAVGYRRENTYYTLPLGVGYTVGLKGARLFTTLEYDHLIRGKNKPYGSDLNSRNILGFGGLVNSAPDVEHAQPSGYGWRLSSMYEFRNWSVGPYVNYWHVDASDRTYFTATVGGIPTPFYSVEPTNNTQEVGLKGFYRF